ncbi:hypothetical protein, partial [Acinetobacter ursingii]|uniref:hypothetical protein n=1 Tax=Acinetobacter ursingii TaxID=108980 RepID=UPI0021CD5ADE
IFDFLYLCIRKSDFVNLITFDRCHAFAFAFGGFGGLPLNKVMELCSVAEGSPCILAFSYGDRPLDVYFIEQGMARLWTIASERLD